MDVNKTSCVIISQYTYIKSECCTLQSNTILHVNNISIFKKAIQTRFEKNANKSSQIFLRFKTKFWSFSQNKIQWNHIFKWKKGGRKCMNTMIIQLVFNSAFSCLKYVPFILLWKNVLSCSTYNDKHYSNLALLLNAD